MTVTSLRVLIGCEYSGTVRRAFAARGHERSRFFPGMAAACAQQWGQQALAVAGRREAA